MTTPVWHIDAGGREESIPLAFAGMTEISYFIRPEQYPWIAKRLRHSGLAVVLVVTVVLVVVKWF